MLKTVTIMPEVPDISSYDVIVYAFSGGKDSLAGLLNIIELVGDTKEIVLMHHDVDGTDSEFMDWPCTKSYCKAIAQHFKLRILFSWKVGGFEGEMLRNNSLTQPVHIELYDGGHKRLGGIRGTPSTRRMFPQKAADLRTRWCSAYLKVDVGSKALIHDPYFSNKRVLFLTGERAEESSSRAKYTAFMPHPTDLRNGRKVKRHIDHWRNVLNWTESRVWSIIARHKIIPHPAYYLGWGRTSCLTCIFGSRNQWATIREYMPSYFKKVADYEREFGVTIDRKYTVDELADLGTPYECEREFLELAMERHNIPKVVTDNWVLPRGAFGESNGPT